MRVPKNFSQRQFEQYRHCHNRIRPGDIVRIQSENCSSDHQVIGIELSSFQNKVVSDSFGCHFIFIEVEKDSQIYDDFTWGWNSYLSSSMHFLTLQHIYFLNRSFVWLPKFNQFNIIKIFPQPNSASSVVVRDAQFVPLSDFVDVATFTN